MNTTPSSGPSASMPPAGEPVFGELITANYGLRCCPCTDKAIADGTPLEDVPEAFTMAPSMQVFTMGAQQVSAPCTIPVCADCRKRQMGAVSKTGLTVAR